MAERGNLVRDYDLCHRSKMETTWIGRFYIFAISEIHKIELTMIEYMTPKGMKKAGVSLPLLLIFNEYQSSENRELFKKNALFYDHR